MKDKTLVVNFYGGPGAGKSIFMMATTAMLKWMRVNAEMAPEYVKDKVYDNTKKVFDNQLYIFGKQQYRMHRLDGAVDVIVTDSPLLSAEIYDAKGNKNLKAIYQLTHDRYENINFFVMRNCDVPYQEEGRFQNKEEAIELDKKFTKMLMLNEDRTGEKIYVVKSGPESMEYIIKVITDYLTKRNIKFTPIMTEMSSSEEPT